MSKRVLAVISVDLATNLTTRKQNEYENIMKHDRRYRAKAASPMPDHFSLPAAHPGRSSSDSRPPRSRTPRALPDLTVARQPAGLKLEIVIYTARWLPRRAIESTVTATRRTTPVTMSVAAAPKPIK
jgi:hypothetical protein